MERLCVEISPTPNPHSLKFEVNRKLADQPTEFSADQSAPSPPLIQTILGFPWALKVFVSHHFISITKEDWVEWDQLKDSLKDLIQEHLEQNPSLICSVTPTAAAIPETKTTAQIKDIIDREIQPAVQMDGGFIEFSNYKDGNVYLRLKGACSGCPSAEWTLKEGIEKRLKAEIPKIKSVISV